MTTLTAINTVQHVDREKRKTAPSSVLGDVFLTGTKIVIGVLMGNIVIHVEPFEPVANP